MQDFTNLTKVADKRNKLSLLYRLFCFPEYKAPWWYWEDFFRANSN